MTATPDRANFLVDRIWYGDSVFAWLLLPLSWLFSIIVRLRVWLYKSGLLKIVALEVPVIVIGNISVGGTGKTPVTIWLCNQLREHGFNPGIISRGYGGKSAGKPLLVSADSDVSVVGDEAVLMAGRTGCPVVVHADRVAAGRAAIAQGVDIILSDDGLQHYRLGRDYEIAVIDGARGFGNGRLLPAGPLRESPSRLKVIDQILEQQSSSEAGRSTFRRGYDRKTLLFRLVPAGVTSVAGDEVTSIEDFVGKVVHAVAAIGNPARFFETLRSLGIRVNEHPMRDHAAIVENDIRFGDDLPVFMTEKDAVKCRGFAAGNCWYVPVELEFDESRGDGWIDYLVQRFSPETEQSA